ncbi:MAG: hypothetical protein ACJASV_000025 [Pseudorhodobacter sp.]|jgi:hypothetical protein
MPSFVLLGTPGYVRDPARFDPEALLKVLGANAGNLMFQYAATQLIDADLTHISPAETPYSDTSALSRAQALVFPAANHLRLGADWTGLNNYLGNCKRPLVIFGLGAQAPGPEGESATIAGLKTDPHVRRLVDILREKAVLVTVRGQFSRRACEELGLTGTLALGCPSVFLNPDPEMGQKLAVKLAGLQQDQAQGQFAPRFALTAAAPFEIRGDAPKQDLERRLFAWARAADGFYVQQSGGLSSMKAADGHWYDLELQTLHSIAAVLAPNVTPLEVWAYLARQGRFYSSAPDWIAAMGACNLVLGTRLHGTMAALAAGTLAAIITHDSRTSELADTMHLPQLSMADAMASPHLGDALGRIRFDGAAFDAWRGRAAAQLLAACDHIGLPLTGPIQTLAGRALS